MSLLLYQDPSQITLSGVGLDTLKSNTEIPYVSKESKAKELPTLVTGLREDVDCLHSGRRQKEVCVRDEGSSSE